MWPPPLSHGTLCSSHNRAQIAKTCFFFSFFPLPQLSIALLSICRKETASNNPQTLMPRVAQRAQVWCQKRVHKTPGQTQDDAGRALFRPSEGSGDHVQPFPWGIRVVFQEKPPVTESFKIPFSGERLRRLAPMSWVETSAKSRSLLSRFQLSFSSRDNETFSVAQQKSRQQVSKRAVEVTSVVLFFFIFHK